MTNEQGEMTLLAYMTNEQQGEMTLLAKVERTYPFLLSFYCLCNTPTEEGRL
jgi:hypothetical protein